METKYKALLALLATVFLWSVLVIVARAFVADVGPMTLLFLRLLIAAVFFTPFLIWRKPWKQNAFSQLVGMSIFSSVNFVFFIWGIQYTTASTSQLIYGAMPILILIVSLFFFKEKVPKRKILGVLVGLLGTIFIIYLSAVEKGTTITGSLIGNLAIVVGMLGWIMFILSSKKLSKIFSPVEISGISVLMSFIISTPLFLWEVNLFKTSLSISTNGIWAAGYMGVFGTFFTLFLHQYALKYLSPLTVSLTSYIQPITTAFLAIIFLGERLTLPFLFGGSLVFFGIFLTSTLEFYHRKNKLTEVSS